MGNQGLRGRTDLGLFEEAENTHTRALSVYHQPIFCLALGAA